jgi:Ca2+-binding RTX toxin-like protein
MTTLIAHTPTDMSDWGFLDDMDAGTVTGHTATSWSIAGQETATYSFGGHNLVYDGGAKPVSGLIRSFNFWDSGTQRLAISGGIDAATMVKYIRSGNFADLQRDWFSGDDLLNGSTGDDHLIGYRGSDLFRLDNGGSDIASGGQGDDTFQLRGAFDNTDRINGGDGIDTLRLNADYFLVCTADMMTNVEVVSLTQSKDYVLHLSGEIVGPGGLLIDGAMLNDGRLEVYVHDATRGFSARGGDSADIFSGSAGDDVLVGGGAGDSLRGGGGEDTLSGGAGRDIFVYNFAAASTGAHFDTITDFDTSGDLIGLDYALAGVNDIVTGGRLTQAHFNDRLEKAIDADALSARHAVLYRPNEGDFAGQTFLVIDANGVAGYQRDADFVINLGDLNNSGALGLEDFALNV